MAVDSIGLACFLFSSLSLAANKAKRSGGLSSSVALPGDLYLGLLFTVEEYRVYVLYFHHLHAHRKCLARLLLFLSLPPQRPVIADLSFLCYVAFCVCVLSLTFFQLRLPDEHESEARRDPSRLHARSEHEIMVS